MVPAWIDLEGAVNARDLAGLPTGDGRQVQPRRLLRSDHLQNLTEADVRLLVDDYGVRTVADLRTGAELHGEGDGPMLREPVVTVHHLSLYPEGTGPGTSDRAVLLPWQQDGSGQRRGVDGVYSRYLDQRPDSVLAAVRLIADPAGATLVHCAAGKDRTGVVVALALAEVGVSYEAIVADYEATAQRIRAIIEGLATRATYREDIDVTVDIDRHTPRAATMTMLLTTLDEAHGGAGGWLRANGWTEADAAQLRSTLLDR